MIASWQESDDKPRECVEKQRHYSADNGCESWAVNLAEHLRIDAFELWCWRRLLKVPCTARRSNQSILGEINPECSLEGLMLKLKLQYFGHLMQGADSLEKSFMLGKIEGRRRRGHQRMRRLDGIANAMDVNLGKTWGMVRDREAGVLQSLGLQRVRHDWLTEQQYLIFSDIVVFITFKNDY